jgi:DNA-binding XRE family transcriptional regulator
VSGFWLSITLKYMTLYQSLDSYIEMHRRKHGLSQEELALLMGVDQRRTIAHLERGTRQPSFWHVVVLERLFGAPASELFQGVAEEVDRRIVEHARTLLEGPMEGPNPVARLEFLSKIAYPDDVRIVPLCPEQ